MAQQYTNRDAVKSALGIPVGSTQDHAYLDQTIDAVSRSIDDYCGLSFGAYVATLYFEADKSDCLYLSTPLRTVTRIRTDVAGTRTYSQTWTSSDYDLEPANATVGPVPRPYWEIETRNNSSATFPVEVPRGVEILGVWGYFDERKAVAATLASGVNATATDWELSGITEVHPGQTLLVGAEQVLIRNVALNSSRATVERAVNGTSATSYSTGTTFQVYTYPIVEQAALYQAELDFRGKDAPTGFTGGEPFGEQRLRGWGGLHPFTRRMIERFRSINVA